MLPRAPDRFAFVAAIDNAKAAAANAVELGLGLLETRA
jgi:hypothetical protein